MISIETLEVAGIGSAIHAMRNPYDSWGKSDTVLNKVGPADRELSEKLSKAGPEHAKHLRMIMVWANIKAPLYWWKEFDTYRAGVEKLSCSTMHTITKQEFTRDMFSEKVSRATIEELEGLRKAYMTSRVEEVRKNIWGQIIHNLPSGFLQRRTVMISYAALRQICKQRRGHKLSEWRVFRKWTRSLPEAWMLDVENEEDEEPICEACTTHFDTDKEVT